MNTPRSRNASVFAFAVWSGVCALLAGTLHAACAASGGVPFDFYRHEVRVQATIDGQGPFPMLLDSGTNPSVIDLPLARKLGLSLVYAGKNGSGGGTAHGAVYQTSLPSVGIGSLSDANVDALAMNLSVLRRRYGRPLMGVLGHSLLQNHIVQWDYPARTVRFLSSLPPPGTARRTLLSIRTQDCVQADGVTVNGQPIVANMDTGSSSAFQLTPKAIRRLRLSAQARHSRSASGAGFNGTYVSRIGTVSRIWGRGHSRHAARRHLLDGGHGPR